jgi:hypothetical protein
MRTVIAGSVEKPAGLRLEHQSGILRETFSP